MSDLQHSNDKDTTLKKALDGDINAFQVLFSDFQAPLKSYLYRLLANRNDAEDLTHDTFIRSYDKLSLFRGESSLKTWVFQIATNLAYNLLKQRSRWAEDVSQRAKQLVLHDGELYRQIDHTARTEPQARYEIREHIDTCFTCIAKNLPIENQIALILKDIYDFSVKEIEMILDKTEGQTKYLLQVARKTMTEIFERRCALVNKDGVCHQCSELNAWFNPRQQQQEALMKIKMVQAAPQSSQQQLYRLRTDLVKHIDPLRSPGHNLQELLLKCNAVAMGESRPEH